MTKTPENRVATFTMLVMRAVSSRLPRIPGLGRLLTHVARHYRKMGLPHVEVSVLGSRMLLDPSDRIGNALIFTPQWFDLRERSAIAGLVPGGAYVVDVGANVGAYTLLLAKMVGPDGAVTAIEAESNNFARLAHNIRLNSYHWVALQHAGVSDKEETLPLLLNSSGNCGGHSFFTQDDTGSPPIQEVHCHPLASLLSDERRITFLKMDIEGFEHRVLKQFLADLPKERHPLYVMIEDNPQRREADAVALCLAEGYRVFQRTPLNVILSHSANAVH